MATILGYRQFGIINKTVKEFCDPNISITIFLQSHLQIVSGNLLKRNVREVAFVNSKSFFIFICRERGDDISVTYQRLSHKLEKRVVVCRQQN